MFFKVVVCHFSLIEQLFLKKFFSRTCTLGEKKNDVQLTFDDSYICYVNKFDFF